MPPKRKKSLIDCSTEPPAQDDNFDVASIASVPSTASATPIKPKAKRPKVEKADKVEKVKAPSKAKAQSKEKAFPKEKEDKEIKDVKTKVGWERKVKAVTGDEAQEVLVEYLTRENRPFSAGDVSGNLHGKVTKTLTDKTPKRTCQCWSHQWKRAKMPELKMEVKKLGIKLAGLKSEIGVQELRDRIEKLEEEKKEKERRLEALKNGGAKVVKKEEVDRVGREFTYWLKMKGIRKRGFLAVEGMLLEGMSRRMFGEGRY
ncbi:hypothetical protein DID88_009956 [Monilinia fructigena]|uniref:Homologous-pairing protein 2 winged helix domain-containing protein n=1 Tax=Monilinia fructigena TaxID=38457 RepID=A0A395IM67_9HELO|nr:hypothetical protein DID88_009956 [Monilinia fructigena]